MAHLTDQAWILKLTPSGENFIRLTLFLESNGVIHALKRQSNLKKKTTSSLDWLDYGWVDLEKATTGNAWFVKSFHSENRFLEIGKNYQTLQAAAQFCDFLIQNLTHLESFDFSWRLIDTVIHSLIQKPHPKATLLKAFYLFAREEGFPVQEDWLPRQSPANQTKIQQILHRPLNAISTPTEEIEELYKSLIQYFKHHTDILPPNLI